MLFLVSSERSPRLRQLWHPNQHPLHWPPGSLVQVTMRSSCQTSMPWSQLLGRRNGRSVIRAIEVDRVFEVAVGANDVSSIMGHGADRYRGAWRPGEFSHSSMSLAVSICRALLRRSSRSDPGANLDACFSRSAFCSANRSANVWGWVRERNMGSSFPVGIRRERAALSVTDGSRNGAVIGGSRFPLCPAANLRNINSGGPCLHRERIGTLADSN
jgi:hypothetical protein